MIPMSRGTMRPERDVDDELRRTPDLDPTDIGVVVKNGVITLSGFVRN